MDFNFPGNLSGIDNHTRNSAQGGMHFGTDRNIFIADEINGASIDLNSNNNEKLYSGGSS